MVAYSTSKLTHGMINMICPKCEKNISLFSKTLNSFGKEKKCPHCQAALYKTMNFKKAMALSIPTVLAYLFILQPIFSIVGMHKGLGLAVLVMIVSQCSLRLTIK